MNTPPEYFEQLFQHSDDPWAFRQRWYEKRKRDLTLACLPQQRYVRAFEPGCANGELSLALAARCDALVAMDLNARAVALAQARLAGQAGAQVVQGSLPAGWPSGCFDLIVFSEMGYYLGPDAWAEAIQNARRSLSENGNVLACHWLHPIAGAPLDGAQVHALLDQHLGLHKVVAHREADFTLEVWAASPSVMDLDEALAQ